MRVDDSLPMRERSSRARKRRERRKERAECDSRLSASARANARLLGEPVCWFRHVFMCLQQYTRRRRCLSLDGPTCYHALPRGSLSLSLSLSKSASMEQSQALTGARKNVCRYTRTRTSERFNSPRYCCSIKKNVRGKIPLFAFFLSSLSLKLSVYLGIS